MKLYYSPGACSLAPHIALKEIGQPYTVELVSTMDGSTRKKEHLNINPKGRVPVLSNDDILITEVSAILIYLATNKSDCNLLSKTSIGLTRTIEWMNWLAGIHASVIAQNWRTERFTDDPSAFHGIQKKGMKNLQETYGQINEMLNGLNWAVDDKYSIVDPYLLVFFRWGNRLGLKMRNYSFWTMHAERMEQRDAVISVLEKEAISIWE